MLNLTLGQKPGALRRVLCLGAHSDDIEIGCGGTILRLLREHRQCEVYWAVFSGSPERQREALASAKLFLSHAASKKIVVHKFRDGFFPHDGARIKLEFEKLKRAFQPDVIFTHYRQDLHQDHRVINELTWNTFRNHLILEYEIPKYDGDLGAPNFYVPLNGLESHEKVRNLQQAFRSQRGKHWFTDDLFLGLMRVRGMEANSPTHYAEAFYARKLVL